MPTQSLLSSPSVALRLPLSLIVLLAALAAPLGSASAGMFLAVDQDMIDPKKGEQPRVTLGFDEKLHRATVTVTAEEGEGFNQTWNFTSVSPGREYVLEWVQKKGSINYKISVEMVSPNGEKYTEDAYAYIVAASPITASIPPQSVDLETRSFDLVTSHAPSYVDLEVVDDDQNVIGKSRFKADGAVDGKATRVTWEQSAAGNVFKVTATAFDANGFWAGVEIIPWTLSIPHEDLNFETGKHDILADEAPKADEAWAQIRGAVDKYGQWVQCSLYVAGYTDTVGDAGSNQGLSERRALALANYFKAKGADFPIWYQGFGEGVQAVPTADGVDEPRNRRALYLITAGPPPGGKDTPRSSWRRLK